MTCSHFHFHFTIIIIKFSTAFKGQLISKTNCQPEDSPKKRTNEFVFTSMWSVFVRFLGESSARKKRFEIYWPLHGLKLYKCSYCAKNSVARFSTTTTYFMGMQIKIQSLKYGMMAKKNPCYLVKVPRPNFKNCMGIVTLKEVVWCSTVWQIISQYQIWPIFLSIMIYVNNA